MNLSTRLFIASLVLECASGFGGLTPQVSFSSRSVALNSHATPHHWPPSSPSIMHSDRTTWNEYEHDFVEPLVPHAEKGDMEPDHECNAEEEDDCYWTENYFVSESPINKIDKRDVADKYWLQKFKEDQDKIHQKEHTSADQQAKKAATGGIGKKDTWDHYTHEYIDHLHQPHEAVLKEVKDPMDEQKRAMADEYWAQKNRDDKQKMAKMSGMDLLP